MKCTDRLKRTLYILLTVASASAVISTQGFASEFEVVRSAVSSQSFVEVTVDSYCVTQTVSENSASVSELKNSTVTAMSGYLSQISSFLLSPKVGAISGGTLIGGRTMGVSGSDEPIIAFSNDVLIGSLTQENISVIELLNHYGESKSQKWLTDLSYNPVSRSVGFVPQGGGQWPMGSLFAVSVTSGILDANNIPLPGGVTFYFHTLIDHTTDNTFSLVDNLKTNVYLPAGSYSQDFFLLLSTPSITAAIQTANQKLMAFSGPGKSPSKVVEITPYDSLGAAMASSSARPARITLSYDDLDKNNDGVVDGSLPPAKTKDLSIWRLDENKKLWVRQSGASFDSLGSGISLDTGHFSTYALIAGLDNDVANIYPYPVPFRPNAGNVARYGSWQNGITFNSTSETGSIRIYNINMELVRELEMTSNTSGTTVWDGKNTSGEKAANGVYIWEARSGKNRKAGKLMIIK
ncbi:MAG: FlgD immunoglobulin-like domain containing protein [Elusimicrobiota bacterium]|nr:FlgD immunoglobulin-like domain containing protein [Elusimicrobiota bacterium]